MSRTEEIDHIGSLIVRLALIHAYPKAIKRSSVASVIGGYSKLDRILMGLGDIVYEDNGMIGMTDEEAERIDDAERGPPRHVVVQI